MEIFDSGELSLEYFPTETSTIGPGSPKVREVTVASSERRVLSAAIASCVLIVLSWWTKELEEDDTGDEAEILSLPDTRLRPRSSSVADSTNEARLESERNDFKEKTEFPWP